METEIFDYEQFLQSPAGRALFKIFAEVPHDDARALNAWDKKLPAKVFGVGLKLMVCQIVSRTRFADDTAAAAILDIGPQQLIQLRAIHPEFFALTARIVSDFAIREG